MATKEQSEKKIIAYANELSSQYRSDKFYDNYMEISQSLHILSMVCIKLYFRKAEKHLDGLIESLHQKRKTHWESVERLQPKRVTMEF